MASKYALLSKHLQRHVHGQWVTLSFGELKKILGFALPRSSWEHQVWWANHANNSQARGWMDAGFAVEAVNLTNGTVRFVRKEKPQSVSSIQSAVTQYTKPAAS